MPKKDDGSSLIDRLEEGDTITMRATGVLDSTLSLPSQL
jgi:hypothetical protein